MGIAKQKWIEAMEGGYVSVPDKHVCARCITDPVLVRLLFPSVEEEEVVVCSYCGGRGAVPVDDVVEHVSHVILAEYTDPANELPYESAEGGYQGHVQDGFEIALFRPPDESDRIIVALVLILGVITARSVRARNLQRDLLFVKVGARQLHADHAH